MRMHYLPQFLLEKFVEGDDGLWELNVTNGAVKRAAVDNAGMQRHLYTVELETGYLQRIDGAASELLNEKVIGQERILLSDAERKILTEWIALLILRNLKKSQSATDFVNQAIANPDAILAFIRERVDELAAALMSEKPVAWTAAVAEFGSEEGARAALARHIEQMIREGKTITGKGPIDLAAMPKNVFSKSITQERAQEWASCLMSYQWLWMRTNHNFLIGDDPVSRWSPKLKHIEYGFAHDDCEVTVPLSRHLTLWMQRHTTGCYEIRSCDHRSTAMWNNRQILAATRKIYGPYNQILREKQRFADMAAGRCALPRGG